MAGAQELKAVTFGPDGLPGYIVDAASPDAPGLILLQECVRACGRA